MSFSYPDLYLIKSLYKKGDKGDAGAAGSSASVLSILTPTSDNTSTGSWETEASYTINVGITPVAVGDIIEIESQFITMSFGIMNIRHTFNGNSPSRTAYNLNTSSVFDAFSIGGATYYVSTLKTTAVIQTATSLYISQEVKESQGISALYGVVGIDFQSNFNVSDITANNLTVTTDVFCPIGRTLRTNYQKIILIKKA